MRHTLSIVFFVLLIMVLAGCAGSESQTDMPAPETTPSQPEPVIVVPDNGDLPYIVVPTEDFPVLIPDTPETDTPENDDGVPETPEDRIKNKCKKLNKNKHCRIITT